MNAATAALGRDPFMPREPRGKRLGLVLALLAHALLIAGLAFSVDWHTTPTEAVEAELWSAVPQQAAPRAETPEVAAPRPVVKAPEPPAPPPKPEVVQPPPPPQVDPQIAIEKAKEAKRVEAQRDLAEQEQLKREKARRDQARQQELDRQEAEREKQQAKDDQARKKQQAEKVEKAEKAEKADRDKADRDKADKEKADKVAAAQQAAARAAYLKRMQGLAGATGESTSSGTAAKSSAPSASYAGRIMARIKPNIVFSDPVEGNPTATVEVKVAPDGTITGRRLVTSSGVKAWDDAVLRAIDRTDGLPRDIDGRVQPVMLINFKRD